MKKKLIKKTQSQSSFFTSPRWAYVGSLLLSVILIFLAFHFEQHLHRFRSLGLLGIFLANLIGSSTIFLPAPAIATVVAGGVIFPPLLVALVAAVGSSLGDLLSYFLGRAGTHVLLNHSEHIFYIKFKKLFSRFASLFIFLFALIPNPFFDAVGILAGATEYQPVKYFLIMFAGRLIRNIFLAFLGAKL